MPTIVKRAGGYQAKIRLVDYPPESETFETRAMASAWGYKREAELKNQRQGGVVKATLQQVIDRYIEEVCPTHKAGDNEAKRLMALAKIPDLLPTRLQIKDLSATHLSSFRDRRLEVVSVATVRKEMTIVRSMLESARRDWGMIVVNPIADVKRPPAPPDRKRLYQDFERDQIIAALGYVGGDVATLQHQVAIALLLAFETAMRAGEMLALTWDRVYLKQRFVTLLETKNGDQRDVPLSTSAVELLEKLKGLDKRHVFTVAPASVDALFRKARDKCKIEDLHFHDSRANAITELAKKLDVLDLARMIGHRDIKNLMIYYRKSATTIAGRLG